MAGEVPSSVSSLLLSTDSNGEGVDILKGWVEDAELLLAGLLMLLVLAVLLLVCWRSSMMSRGEADDCAGQEEKKAECGLKAAAADGCSGGGEVGDRLVSCCVW